MNDLIVPARLSWEQWTLRIREVGQLRDKLPWYVGDLQNMGIKDFGERAWQEIEPETLRYSQKSIGNLKYVAGRFPPEERNSQLSWSMHQDLASFPKREREKLITQALKGELKRADLRRLKSEGKTDGAQPVPEAPSGLEMAENGVASAYVTVAKLMERQERGPLTLNALDELIEKAMLYREELE